MLYWHIDQKPFYQIQYETVLHRTSRVHSAVAARTLPTMYSPKEGARMEPERADDVGDIALEVPAKVNWTIYVHWYVPRESSGAG